MLNANARNCFYLSLILLLGLASGNALAKGQTTRVSVASDGTEGDFSTTNPSISADGRYVVFSSFARNLVTGDTNGTDDVFVHDRLTKQTTRVSVATGATEGNGPSTDSILSGDGRYVAFGSEAFNLVASDTNGVHDIFVHDRLTKQTTLVSVSTNGTQANSYSFRPHISADGRYVAFLSYASNLVAGDTNASTDIFIHDRLTKQTSRVSVATGAVQGNYGVFLVFSIYHQSLSADGRYVAFTSGASNLVASDTNGTYDVFVHDRLTKQTTRASVATGATEGNGYSTDPILSADGRYVVFSSKASNLVFGDTNKKVDTFIYDHLTQQTT